MKMSELLNEISMYLKAEDILNSENMIPIENVKELIDELQQKENIIKEVREYIEKHSSEPKTHFYGIPKYRVFNGNVEDILRILDNKKIYGDKIQIEWFEESEILDKGD